MPQFFLKYADDRGRVHEEVATAPTAREIREKLRKKGYIVYSIKPQATTVEARGLFRKPKLNPEKFLVFNQQFVTLIKAGLPVVRSLELLAQRQADKRLREYIARVRDDVRDGYMLSEAFRRQGVFPAIYVTSVMAGEKSGSLAEVLDRFIQYQRLVLGVRKKLLLSLIYPSFLVVLVLGLVVFLMTYVVPRFAELYSSMEAELPRMTQVLIAISTTARSYILGGFLVLLAAIVGFQFWSRSEAARLSLDRLRLRLPVVGDLWLKYQIALLCRILSTLLLGGIPLVQAMQTAGESFGSPLIRNLIEHARKLVREGQSLASAIEASKIVPELATEMIEVGESTGALPAMLNSVAEFFEDEVTTRTTAMLSLVEPILLIVMGAFVAFVLVSLYLPIFSIAETIG